VEGIYDRDPLVQCRAVYECHFIFSLEFLQLDYKVDAKKLKQVFKLAGRIYSLDLSVDKDGNSRGFAVIG
jgi:hypothetical protein